MLYSSYTFLFMFLPIALALYYLSPKNMKNITLLLLSLFFYSWGQPFYAVLLVLSSLIDFYLGLLMQKVTENAKRRKLIFIFSLCLNIIFLFIFKYFSFLIDYQNIIFGLDINAFRFEFPIGISFLVLQKLSYLIDVYNFKIKPSKSFLEYLLYVVLFMKILAGPLMRFADFQKQLRNKRVDTEKIASGINLFIIGLAKKVLIANNIYGLWESVKETPFEQLSMLSAWLGIVGFAFSIYFDFSGYCDMGVGLGKIFGFDFARSFYYPYTAKNISEFCRRWYTTLGDWFREYVYFPLGGFRKGKFKGAINAVVVTVLTSIWYGSGWNYLLWGFYLSLILIFERFISGKIIKLLPKVFQVTYAFILILFGWVIFEVGNGNATIYATIVQSLKYIFAMVNGNNIIADANSSYLITTYGVVLIVGFVGASKLLEKLYERFIFKSAVAKNYIIPVLQGIIFVICIIFLIDKNDFSFLNYKL